MSIITAIRLQKFLSQAGIASRRKAEEFISSGFIQVNGKVVTELGTKVIPGKDEVKYKGRTLKSESLHFYLFHKPRNVLSTMSDPRNRPCLGDYVSTLPVKVFPLGRLDFDVNGLILFTNDGDYADHLLHPRYAQERTYWAIVKGSPSASEFNKLKRGIMLEDGKARVSAIHLLSEKDVPFAQVLLGKADETQSFVEVKAQEGRNHFIKRILAKVDLDVVKLCRIGFGPYRLGKLGVGEIREIRYYKKT
ncbi:MAG: rRNA pseudouridine synthase [Deltaproteobacteria bacterium]|nr:rRNA pseudouridine synthase [Deltaproteobacteria bacterium]